MYNEINIPFLQLIQADNIAEILNDEQRKYVGKQVVDWYAADDLSRSEWMKKNKVAMELSMQLTKEKSYPWPNSSNVKFPLLTIAALQFSARVYPALIKAPNLVKYRVMGSDPDGKKASRAGRVSSYMSYQLLEEDEHWEEHQDKLMIALPITGCMFKKTMYDPLIERNRSRVIFPQNLVVDYFAKDIEDARATELFELSPSAIRERILRKLYVAYDVMPGLGLNQTSKEAVDKRQGLSPPPADMQTPREMLECHCFWDFDGDGLNEPYVITVDKEKGMAVRIVKRFEEVVSEQSLQMQELYKKAFFIQQSIPPPEMLAQMPPDRQAVEVNNIRAAEAEIMGIQKQIEQLGTQPPNVLRIVPKCYFTKYSFIPSPDGGFYDLGFGQLLGPINQSVDTIINQLIDSGTLQNGNMGFIGKGARIQGGKMRFEPYEWKRVAVAGATLKDSLVPLPVNQPSPVLFQMLGLLIQYAERIGSVTDIMSGENPGQNTPAFNMNAMLEQGLQVFNGVFKRIYRSFRQELRKLYKLNAEYLDPINYFETMDGQFTILQSDFTGDAKDLLPASDPNAFSNMEKLQKAVALKQASMAGPGYNMVAVERRYLEALDIPDVQEVFPINPDGTPAIPPPQNPELELEKADLQRKAIEGKIRGEVDAALAESQIMLNQAQAEKLSAEAEQVGKGDASDRMKILAEQMKMKREEMKGKIDMMLKMMDLQIKKEELQLKKQEMNMDLQMKEKEMNMQEHQMELDKDVAEHKASKDKEVMDHKAEGAKKEAKASGNKQKGNSKKST